MTMLKLSLFIGCVFASALQGYAQTDTLQLLIGGEPLTYVEDPPQFSEGNEAMYHFLSAHIRYPAKAREHGVQGTVVVKYVVDIDSTLKRMHIVRHVGGGCDEEVIRIMQLMNEQKLWRPGTFNGRAVPVWYSLPVKFILPGLAPKKDKTKRE